MKVTAETGGVLKKKKKVWKTIIVYSLHGRLLNMYINCR